MKAKYKSIFQNIFGTLAFIAVFGVIIYFGFYLRVSQTDSQTKEITGTVKDKWIDISETQQGSGFELKALVETEAGEKVTIKCSRKTHDQIKIGTLVKRKPSGDIKILQ